MATSVESQELLKVFPGLYEFVITGPPSTAAQHYNCVGWTANPQNPHHRWPPDIMPHLDPMAAMDAFYATRQLFPDPNEPDVNCTGPVVALYADGAMPKHVALRRPDFPGWWESKLGQWFRIVHRRADLEGLKYGRVVAFYWRKS